MSRKKAPTQKKVYLDACLFIARQKRDVSDTVLESIDNLFSEIEAERMYAVSGTVLMAELLDNSFDLIDKVLDGIKGELIDGSGPIMSLARTIRKKTRRRHPDKPNVFQFLDLPDCIHIATASIYKCDCLVTTDGISGAEFSMIGLSSVILREFGVEIVTPMQVIAQQPLPI
ncbi:MAG TPA: hypothetical protein VG944_07285 [Fimbriimonas sp.]|nr:hypothetical protein [Fimbriimonas sp.]